MRKPDLEIYEFVIEQNNLDPVETIMIDDRSDNLEGAKRAGLQTLHVSESYTILDHFN
jgi:putative hydrolase of the HAD superfamily